MAGPISALAAKALAHAEGEVAFLDVREHGLYGEGHPFLAVPAPSSRLELDVAALAPRCGVPILLVDAGDGVAERAAATLETMGYCDVSWIEGGAAAWAAAGFTLFKGVNLPSKTLGELLEAAWHVPRIDVDTLSRWQEEGRAHRLFDGRPSSEYARMTIPGAASGPNGELAHRAGSVLADPAIPVVIHCAGRTRSIVGAAGLALAGLPNPVYALENGTQGWALSGRTLDRGAHAAPLPVLDEAALAASAARAGEIVRRHGLTVIDGDGLRRLCEDGSRTLYGLDVRSAEEFAAGTLPGAIHAPVVQLVQAADGWLGVRRARVVLIDDTGLRAALAAIFLRALRYEVFVLPGVASLDDCRLERRDAPAAMALASVETIDAGKAVARAASGEALLDLRGSLAFRADHLAGARWTIRPRLVGEPVGDGAMLIGDADTVALVARDLADRGIRDIRRIEGDPSSWRAAGLPVVATPDEPADAEAIDHLFFVHDRHDGNMDAARRYLAWEQGLVAQLDAAERAEYRIGPSPFATR